MESPNLDWILLKTFIFSLSSPFLCNYTTRFDKVSLDKIIDRVADLPDPQLDPAVKKAFDDAYDYIYASHYAQKAPTVKVENMKGVHYFCGSLRAWGNHIRCGNWTNTLLHRFVRQLSYLQCLLRLHDEKLSKKAGVTHILKTGGSQAISDGNTNINFFHACRPFQPWRGGVYLVLRWRKFVGFGTQYVTATCWIWNSAEHVLSPDSQVVLVIYGDGVDVEAIEKA